MAQTIKLKRSATSGAVPTTGSLELGEVAINTHDGKVYIKKNDGAESVVEVGADQTPAELLTAVKTVDGSGSGLDADLLDGQHGSYYYPASNPNGYTNDQTAAEILTAIKTVDGSGSGLDADTVDGHHAYESQILDTRDSGDVTPDGFGDKRVSYSFTDEIAGSTHTWDSAITVKGWSDTYRAWQITSNSSNDDTDQNLYFRSGRGATWGSLRTVWDSGNDGIGSGLDADLLDGVQGSGYVNTTGAQTVGGVKNFTSNVGIGTSSPSAKLEVNGGVGVATTGGTLIVRQDGDTNSDGIALTSSNATSHRFWKDSGGKLNIGPSSLPSALVQDLSGKVGIGTTTPQGKLSVSNNGAEGIEFFPANASGLNTTQHYNRSGAAYVVNKVIASEHRFNIGTSERARLDTSGNFLINKTGNNPSVQGCQLSPNGTINSTVDIPVLSGGIQIRNNSSTDSLTALRCFNGLADIYTTSSTGGGHSLSISGGLSGEYARFTNAKRLGIGTTAPAESLHVVGNIVATGNITAYYSDERLKDLKGTIPNALDKVNQLNGYYYTPNETAQALGVDNKGLEVGISAQEVEAVLPEIVTKSAIGDDYKTVWYEKLTPLLIEAVKELTEKVDKLEARLTELEK